MAKKQTDATDDKVIPLHGATGATMDEPYADTPDAPAPDADARAAETLRAADDAAREAARQPAPKPKKPKKGDAAPVDAPAPTPKDAATRELDLGDTPAPPVRPLEFTSGDDRLVTRIALSHYIESLKKLAKDSEAAARHGDAARIRRDMERIRTSLLAQVENQTTMAFTEAGTLFDALTHTVGRQVRASVGRALSETEAKSFEKAFDKIATLTAKALQPMLLDLAERAFDAGVRSRQLTPETLARQAVYYGSEQAAQE